MCDFLIKLPLHVYVAFGASFLICLVIIKTKRWHIFSTLDYVEGIQKVHFSPTPRIGGLAVLVGVICAYFVSKGESSSQLGSLILTGSAGFLFGLAEDLTKKVSVTMRLLATIFAGVVGWFVTGISLTHIGITYLDPLFKSIGFSLVFTAVAVGGISNAINIVDGLNGLASSILVIALVSITAIAYSVDDMALAITSVTVGAAIFGFFLVNWPLGKLFLGDGGSYFGGISLAWICVLLVERNQSISPFTGLLLCIYPFTEALFSIFRRVIKTRKTTSPDFLHLHSLIYRRYFATKNMRVRENSLSGILMGLLSIPPAVCAYYFRNNNALCLSSAGIFIIAYMLIYVRVVRFKMKRVLG
jgi:UDP-N-acetylmuramyl pentapeptide phosphotransferase/UDP-N-acetylglucosamine-1-phosphate transferase